MASNTLNNRSDGETITKEFFNDVHQALDGDLVGRNATGVPTTGQNLGTAAIPWGTVRTAGIIVGGSSIDVSQVSAPPFRVTSGATRSTSNQPAYLDPAGPAGGAAATILGATTSLVYDVAGTTVTLSADLALSGLTLAPSTNNTALVNDADAADQEATRLWGEDFNRKTITIDTVGTEISGKVGDLAAFKINDGATDEYFLARIKSATELTECLRGHFYDSALAPINRITFANNDTITLMSLGWVFLEDNATTTDVTYTEPSYSTVSPSSPSTGDYWYDLANSLWKRYDGATFATVDRTLIGMVVLDDTDCIASRSEDFDARYRPDNGMVLELSTTEIVQTKNVNAKVNVAGNEIVFGTSRPDWNITTDLATSADMYNATEQADTTYHLYLKDDGATVISDISPYWSPQKYGWYHPHNPWRKVGAARNDNSSDIVSIADFVSYEQRTFVYDQNGWGSTNQRTLRWTSIEEQTASVTYSDSATLGGLFVIEEPGHYEVLHINEVGTAGPHGFGITQNESTADLAATLFNTSRNAVLTFGVTSVGSGNVPGTETVNKFFNIGDEVRSKQQGGGLTDGTSADLQRFVIKKISGPEKGM